MREHLKKQIEQFRKKSITADSPALQHVGTETRGWEVETVSRLLKPGDKLLDIGAGTCSFTIELYGKVKNIDIYAFDISPEMIEKAKTNVKNAGINNISFFLGNAEEMEFEDDFFDAAFMRLTIHHFEFPDLILNEIKRILRPGGRIILMEALNFDDRRAEEFYDAVNEIREPSLYKFYSGSEFQNMLGKHFENVEYKTKSYDLNLEKWLSWYEETERVLDMFYTADDYIKKVFALRPVDNGHLVTLSNIVISGIKSMAE